MECQDNKFKSNGISLRSITVGMKNRCLILDKKLYEELSFDVAYMIYKLMFFLNSKYVLHLKLCLPFIIVLFCTIL
jgi:hypothetical protein